jgi:hypothetical protein
MNAKKLDDIEREIESCRRKANKSRDLEKLAIALERKRFTGRGKEPTYISTAFPGAPPLTIPYHAGKDLKPGTQKNILNQLETDVLRFRQKLEDESQKSRGYHEETKYKH